MLRDIFLESLEVGGAGGGLFLDREVVLTKRVKMKEVHIKFICTSFILQHVLFNFLNNSNSPCRWNNPFQELNKHQHEPTNEFVRESLEP